MADVPLSVTGGALRPPDRRAADRGPQRRPRFERAAASARARCRSRARGLRAIHVAPRPACRMPTHGPRIAKRCCESLDIPLAIVRVEVARGRATAAKPRRARHAMPRSQTRTARWRNPGAGPPSRRPGRNLPAARVARLRSGRPRRDARRGARSAAAGCGGRCWRTARGLARIRERARPATGSRTRRNADAALRPQFPAQSRAAVAARALAASRCRVRAQRSAAAPMPPHLLDADDDASLDALDRRRHAASRMRCVRCRRTRARACCVAGSPPRVAAAAGRRHCAGSNRELLAAAATDAAVRFAWRGAIVRMARSAACAVDRGRAARRLAARVGRPRRRWRCPTAARSHCKAPSRFDAPLQRACRAGGERIVLPGRTHSHALKHVLQDRGLPPWQRARLPLLFDARWQPARRRRPRSSPRRCADWLARHGARLHWRDAAARKLRPCHANPPAQAAETSARRRFRGLARRARATGREDGSTAR